MPVVLASGRYLKRPSQRQTGSIQPLVQRCGRNAGVLELRPVFVCIGRVRQKFSVSLDRDDRFTFVRNVVPIGDASTPRLQRRTRRIEPTHPVDPAARGSCGRAEVDALDAGGIGVQPEPGTRDDLSRRVRTRGDVATHVVGVVRLHLRHIAHVDAHDPVPEPRRKPLDLTRDHIGCVTRIAVRHMRIRPDRVDVSDGPGRVGQELLAQQNEGLVRHLTPNGLAFDSRSFRNLPGQMQGAGLAGVHIRPRHDASVGIATHGVVDLVGGGAVAEFAVRPGDAVGLPAVEQTTGRVWCDIEHHDVVIGDLGVVGDPVPGFDSATEAAQDRCERRSN